MIPLERTNLNNLSILVFPYKPINVSGENLLRWSLGLSLRLPRHGVPVLGSSLNTLKSAHRSSHCGFCLRSQLLIVDQLFFTLHITYYDLHRDNISELFTSSESLLTMVLVISRWSIKQAFLSPKLWEKNSRSISSYLTHFLKTGFDPNIPF